jgi:DnaJ like chaperone protein
VSEGGEFFTSAPIFDGRCRVYLPFGALDHPTADTYDLLFSVLHALPGTTDFKVLGTSAFNVQLPAPRRWSKVEWLRPLIDLSMAVVHADGKVLPVEVRMVKTYFTEVFELGADELVDLKDAMKQGPPPRLEEIVADVAARLPALGVAEVLAVLAAISICDGEVHPSEVEVIRRAATLMGVPPVEWERVARELGLTGGPSASRPSRSGMGTAEAFRTLGIEPSASRAEVQAAYRKLVTEYHPDRVTNLPEEFQKVAHEKMTQINAAYDTLKKT